MTPVALSQTRSDATVEARQRELWNAVKTALLSDQGPQYFANSIHHSLLPPLKGTVVAASPPDNPNTIVLALSDDSTPEVTLELIEREPVRRGDRRPASLRRRVDAGDEIEFSGIGVKFSRRPFMLTFDAPVDRITLKPHSR
jgi:hypothetical protein